MEDRDDKNRESIAYGRRGDYIWFLIQTYFVISSPKNGLSI